MENLPARVPYSLFPDLVSAFVPPDTPRGSVLELIITIESYDLPARELAEYLAIIDRIYGRMSREGLRSYAHREWGRLTVTEVRSGSTEIIFQFFYDHVSDAATVIVILFFLKGLPNLFKITAEGIKHLAEAYKSFEEARNVREDRLLKVREERLHKQAPRKEESMSVREERHGAAATINISVALQQMDEPRKSQLATLLNALFKEERSRLSSPMRFARRHVKDVVLRIRGKNPPY